MLLQDPTSRFHAAVAGWEHPISREGMYGLDLIDVLLMRWAGDKFKPVGRPWDKAKVRGRAKLRTRAEALRILRPSAEQNPDEHENDDAAQDGARDGQSQSLSAEFLRTVDAIKSGEQGDDSADDPVRDSADEDDDGYQTDDE